MRWLIVLCFGLLTGNLSAQGYYQKSVDAYRALKYDSAFLYIETALNHYRTLRVTDSLVLAYIQKADMVWSQKSTPLALAVIDSAIIIAKQLPFKNPLHVAAFNKKGQIHVHNKEAEKGKKYLLQALDHVDKNAAPNGIYSALYTNLSWLFLELQDFTPALAYAEEAKKINENLYGKDARQLLGVYQSLMLIAHDAGWYNQAEQYGLEFYRLANLNLPANHPNKGLMHNDLGILYESMYRLDEALFHKQQMVHIIQQDYAKHKNPQLLAIAYNNMGSFYHTIGELQLALEYYDKAKQLHEINYGAESAGIVRPLTHLANLKSAVGNYDEADSLYARAYALQKVYAGGDWLNLAYVESQYGDLFFNREQYAEAEDFYLKALNNNKKAGITSTSIVEQTRTTLAEVYAHTGRSGEAIAILRKVLEKYRSVYPPGNIVIAGQYNKISNAYLLNDQPAQALLYSDSTFLELLQIPVLPDGGWIEKLPFNHHIIRYLQNRAAIESRLYKKNGKTQQLHKLLQLANGYGIYLQKSLPALRTQASLLQLATQHKAIYNAAMEACWELHQKEPAKNFAEKAFEFSERSKALLLRLAANNIMVDASRSTKNAADEKDLYWRKRISSLNTQYIDAGSRNDSLLTLLTAAMEGYYRFQDSMLQSGNGIAKLKYNLQPLSINEIRRQMLREGQTLLQYAVTDTAVFIFVLNNKGFYMHRLQKRVLDDVTALKDLYSLSATAFREPAYRLYQQLIQPVEQHFISGQLIVVPDAELYYLNFELLVSDNNAVQFNKMNYLVRRYNIAYQLSATNAVLLQSARPAAGDRAMLLVPVFTDEMKDAYRTSVGDTAMTDPQYYNLLRQPFTLLAAQQISRHVKNDLFTGQSAIESVFKQLAAGYHILHLGTHAEVNHTAPLQSRFFMAKPVPADSTGMDDGYLHAYEIYATPLQAELAVLTACETGSGNWSQGEGVMSLAHSFMYAGCPSVVMSLWKIDEKASADIITRFYKYLAKGLSKSEALRSAKLHHIEASHPALSHPYFWAGMTLVGDSSPLYTSYAWLWFTGGALILAAMLGFLFFRPGFRKK
ncbi:CHAT domain-containing tetratricopeptide repeat protein [Agriterribacter sp.]|uniref:CHAT domain-containing protein n=1 Tax=Agriterribacter sp. TaxID=2821509 RepID=UPI002C8B9CE4|nr:CHAT domain-containing tetratricopeptide repeat protein [Agriterribacter sp.]HRO44769.1 CHAT domain-containing protein [Agriterribacter sp.]